MGRVPLNLYVSDEGTTEGMPVFVDRGTQRQAVSELAHMDTFLNQEVNRFLVSEPDSLNPVTKAAAGFLGGDELSRSGKTITPEEANLRFPDMPTKWREAVNENVAQFQYDQAIRRKNLESIVAQGPQGVLDSIADFGIGLGAHLMDPIEFGIGAVTGFAAGALVKGALFGRGMMLAELTPTLKGIPTLTPGVVTTGKVALSTTERLASTAIEGTIGSAAQTGAAEAQLANVSEAMNQEYDVMDRIPEIAVNLLAGAFFFSGMKEGTHQMTRLGSIIKKTSPEMDAKIIGEVKKQMDAGVKINIEPLVKHAALETDVTPSQVGLPEYIHVPINTPEQIKGKSFFVGSRDAAPTLMGSDAAPAGQSYFPDSLTVSDNMGVANATAARSEAPNLGSVHEVYLDGDIKPIYEVDPIPERLKPFLKYFENEEPTNMKEFLDVMDSAIEQDGIHPEVRDRVKQALKEDGYNVIVSDGVDSHGFDHSPHNKMTVLDNELVKHKKTIPANEKLRRVEPDLDYLADYANKPENQFLHDQRILAQHAEDMKNNQIIGEYTVDDLVKDLDSHIEDLKTLEKDGGISPEERTALKGLEYDKATLEINKKFQAHLRKCMGG